MSFFSRLSERARQVDSLLCVGLDPHPSEVGSPSVEAVRSFCLRLIEATHSIAAAYKPNSAFFEAYGAQGMAVLKEVISSIPKGIPVILDAKRGDIASTAEAYAQAAFQLLGADSITLNPYLGRDSLEPFLKDPERGVFMLCKTSNPGAKDVQDLCVSRETGEFIGSTHYLYEKVALLAQEWNTRDNLGIVVGATYPEALERVRKLAPELWILAPGVGLQGGDLEAALQAGLRGDGMGMLVPVSRGISQAKDPHQAADQIRHAIKQYRAKSFVQTPKMKEQLKSEHPSASIEQLADGLLEAGCIKFGEFTLKSGLVSPIYIDLRQLVSFQSLLQTVARAYLPILQRLSFDRLAGLPYAALPIATLVSVFGDWPLIYPRKEAKSYGTKAEIEGIFKTGERVVVIDDLATTGESKFESIDKLATTGLRVTDIVVLIDRQSGAREALDKAGYRLHSVMTLSELLDYYELHGKVPADRVKLARDFMSKGT